MLMISKRSEKKLLDFAKNNLSDIEKMWLEQLFDRERETFACVRWTHEDLEDKFEEIVGREPTKEETEQIENLIWCSLEDCSSGWEIIEDSVREYEGKLP